MCPARKLTKLSSAIALILAITGFAIQSGPAVADSHTHHSRSPVRVSGHPRAPQRAAPPSSAAALDAQPITVQQLNPTSDPAGGNCQDGYSSGTGFQGTPQVIHESVDLSQFDHQAIQLRFSFSTGDNLYNAFEGWYLKNIRVTGTQSGSPVTVFSDPVTDEDMTFTVSSQLGTSPGWHVTDRRDSSFGGPAWWYGNEATGTYQSPNPIDNCTDSSANSGTVTSSVFTLPSNSQLSFDTLWQIESVNPSSFDLMQVQVIPVSGPLTIETTSLPSGTVGSPYQTSFAAIGGTPPYKWSITQGQLPTGSGGIPWSLDSTSGQISGTPVYAGMTTFTATVTDSAIPPSSVSQALSVVVEPSQPPQQWQLCLFGQCPATNQANSPNAVVTNPHVAFVLVGNWWCDLVSSNQDPQCKFPKYPFKCPGYAGNSCLVEGSQFLGVLNDLVAKDYSDANPGGYDWGLSQFYDVTNCGIFSSCITNYVGAGLTRRYYAPYGGSFFAGPVITGKVSSGNVQATLNGFVGGFGIQSQADVDNTVFVLLYAPNLLSCPNPSTNGQTGPGRPGEYGNIVVANVYLEDYQHSCSGDFNQSANPTTTISPGDFATYATSHEIDEAITDPGGTTRGWYVPPALQIADPCHSRNADGETAYTSYPFENFTRDSQGTVVSAYVNPVTSQCYPSVDTSVPPG